MYEKFRLCQCNIFWMKLSLAQIHLSQKKQGAPFRAPPVRSSDSSRKFLNIAGHFRHFPQCLSAFVPQCLSAFLLHRPQHVPQEFFRYRVLSQVVFQTVGAEDEPSFAAGDNAQVGAIPRVAGVFAAFDLEMIARR